MATEATIIAGTGSSGTAAGVATAIKAFVLAHPVTLSLTGGVLLGAGTYYAVNNWRRKRKEGETAAEAAAAAAT